MTGESASVGPESAASGTTVYETARLVVRHWTAGEPDVARVLAIYAEWEVARWLGARPRAMADRAEALRAIERWAERHAANRRLGVWAVQIRDTGVVAGSVLVNLLPNSDGSAARDVEVGWHLHPDCWGHGYATEAARGALRRTFALGVPEVFAVVYPANARSLAVCRRLGMTPLGRTSRWYGVEVEAFRLGRDAEAFRRGAS